MLFAIIAKDKPNSLAVRLANRDAHLAYAADAGDRLVLAGPFLDAETDGKMCGSLLIIDAASHKAAELFAENDPYNQAGLFESVEVRPWKAAIGTWKGE